MSGSCKAVIQPVSGNVNSAPSWRLVPQFNWLLPTAAALTITTSDARACGTGWTAKTARYARKNVLAAAVEGR